MAFKKYRVSSESVIKQLPFISTPNGYRQVTSYYLNNDPVQGVRHRENGPAVILESIFGARTEEYWTNGHRTYSITVESSTTTGRYRDRRSECFYNDQGLHRDNGPAAISVDNERKQHCEEYWQNGKLHRDDGPAIIETYAETVHTFPVYRELYYTHGVLGRLNGPTILKKYEDGCCCEEYHLRGQLHRENSPAVIVKNKSGDVIYQEYFLNGVLHRDNGPAIISTPEFHASSCMQDSNGYDNFRKYGDNQPPVIFLTSTSPAQQELYYYHGHKMPAHSTLRDLKRNYLVWARS